MALVNYTSEIFTNILPNLSYNVDTLGKIIGNESLLLIDQVKDNTTVNGQEQWRDTVNGIFSITMVLILIFITLGMGCHVNFREVLGKFRAPLPIIIGMCGQFILMPAMAFGILKLFRMDPYVALGTLVISCSPGGTFSNLFTYWIDGDVALSLVMTTCSTILSFGTMPLNIWMYGSNIVGADSNTITIPYENILTILGFVVGPFIIGMTIRHFNEWIANWITKIASMLGNISVAINVVTLFILYWDMLAAAKWYIHVSVLILPISGMVITYLVAYIFRMAHIVCRTVAIETAAQNVTVAMGVIVISFSEVEVRNKLMLYPTLYAMYMLLEILIGVGSFRWYRYWKQKRSER